MTSVSNEEIDSVLANMVVNNYIYAKINRIENIVNFQKKRNIMMFQMNQFMIKEKDILFI